MILLIWVENGTVYANGNKLKVKDYFTELKGILNNDLRLQRPAINRTQPDPHYYGSGLPKISYFSMTEVIEVELKKVPKRLEWLADYYDGRDAYYQKWWGMTPGEMHKRAMVSS